MKNSETDAHTAVDCVSTVRQTHTVDCLYYGVVFTPGVSARWLLYLFLKLHFFNAFFLMFLKGRHSLDVLRTCFSTFLKTTAFPPFSFFATVTSSTVRPWPRGYFWLAVEVNHLPVVQPFMMTVPFSPFKVILSIYSTGPFTKSIAYCWDSCFILVWIADGGIPVFSWWLELVGLCLNFIRPNENILCLLFCTLYVL